VGRKKARLLDSRIEPLSKQIERWRRTRTKRSAMPEVLWGAASARLRRVRRTRPPRGGSSAHIHAAVARGARLRPPGNVPTQPRGQGLSLRGLHRKSLMQAFDASLREHQFFSDIFGII
jgi:hypothetical protein